MAFDRKHVICYTLYRKPKKALKISVERNTMADITSSFAAAVIPAQLFPSEGFVEFLIVRNAKSKTCRFPGGGVETGETPFNAMLREVREEITDGRLFNYGGAELICKIENPDDSGKGAHQKIFFFMKNFVGPYRCEVYREKDGVALFPPEYVEARKLFQEMSEDPTARAHLQALICALAKLAVDPKVLEKYYDIVRQVPDETP